MAVSRLGPMGVPMIGADQDFSGKVPGTPVSGGVDALGFGQRRLGRRRFGGLWCLLFILAAGCVDVDLVAPEDERCTIYVGYDEVAQINRWQIEHCESVSIVVVRFA